MVLVAGVCLLLFFFRLDGFGFVGADEPRYAQVAREMLERHDWVTPVLYGHHWLEKPIGYYWGAMVSYKLFGVSDWAARLPVACLATLMVFAVYLFLSRFRPAARTDGALMVASSALVIGFGRGASTDMPLTAAFTVAMLAWFAWRTTDHRGWLIAAYAAIGVGTLAKGPVAPALAFAIIFIFCVVERDWRSLWRTLWLPGIAVFLLVTAPWYVFVQMRTPEFFRVFILEHNLGRFGSNMFRHKQPFWYYVPVLVLATMPWTVMFVTSLVSAVREWWSTRNQPSKDDGLTRFLLIFIVVPVLFFSISQAKLPGYILPAIPPCLILSADYVIRRRGTSERMPIWTVVLHALLLAVVGAAVLFAPSLLLKAAASQQALVSAALVATIVFFGVAATLLARGWAMLRFATLVPLVLLVGFILRTLSPIVDVTQSARPAAMLLQKLNLPPETKLVTFKEKRDLDFGLAFYRNKPVDAYEGLEVSPHQYEIPPHVPTEQHVAVIRAGSADELKTLLADRQMILIGFDRRQRIEVYRIAGE